MTKRLMHEFYGKPKYAPSDVKSRDGVDTASNLFKMWSNKDPVGAHVVPYEFPEQLHQIGTAKTIIYASDKWEQDGDTYNYIHEFESHPPVYSTSEIAPNSRNNPSMRTSELINADINGDVPLPMLALVKRFEYTDNNTGKSHDLTFSGKEMPLLCMTNDAKGIIIFMVRDGKDIPIVVRGGEMYVNAHGIIK